MNKKDSLKPTRAEEIASQKQLEKYALQGDSRGEYKKAIRQNKEAPNPRKETQEEFINRTIWETSDTTMAKPQHMDNLNIIKEENWKKPPKPFNGYSNLSDDQKQQSVSWENHLSAARTAKTPEEREEALDTKRMIMREYNNPQTRKNLPDDELKLINKHRSQLNRPVVTPVTTRYDLSPEVKTEVKKIIPRQPEMTLKEHMRLNSVIEPGLSEDFISLNKEIKKNFDYVMGDKKTPTGEKVESQDKDPTDGGNYD